MVFPTPVGVNRMSPKAGNVILGIPHARGGEPLKRADMLFVLAYSPRPWG